MSNRITTAEQIEALGVGQKLLGNSITWEVKAGLAVKPADLAAKVKAAGLNERVLRPIRKKTAFIRALDSCAEVGHGVMSAKKVPVIEDDYRTVYVIYRTIIDPTNEDVSLKTQTKAVFEKSTGIVTAEGEFAQEILDAYQHFREHYTSEDLRVILTDLIRNHCDFVKVGDSGRVLFVPITGDDELTRIRSLYRDNYSGNVFKLPVVDNQDARESVGSMAVTEIDGEMAELEEIVKGLTKASNDRSFKAAMKSFEELKQRHSNWNTLIGGFTKESAERMETIANALAEKMI